VTCLTTLGGRLVLFRHRRAKDSSHRDVSDRCSRAVTRVPARGRRTVEYARRLGWGRRGRGVRGQRETVRVGGSRTLGERVTI